MTGLEPATSGVTGRCSNQLSYIPKFRGHREPTIHSCPLGLLQDQNGWSEKGRCVACVPD